MKSVTLQYLEEYPACALVTAIWLVVFATNLTLEYRVYQKRRWLDDHFFYKYRNFLEYFWIGENASERFFHRLNLVIAFYFFVFLCIDLYLTF